MDDEPRRWDNMDLLMLEQTPSWEWPSDAGETLLKVLRSQEAEEANRILAANLAGDIVVASDEIADVLLAILCDGGESEELRGQAAISLGPVLEYAEDAQLMDDMPSPYDEADEVPISEETFEKIQKTFASLYVDAGVPKTVRRRILEASVRAENDWHQDAVRAAYASGDADWRLTAVFCMQYVKGFDAQILESLAGTDPEIRYHAVRAAGNWGVDAAWPHITSLLAAKDTDKPMLLAAIDAVASIRPAKAQAVLDKFTRSKDEDIAEAADEAIAMAESEEDEDDFLH